MSSTDPIPSHDTLKVEIKQPRPRKQRMKDVGLEGAELLDVLSQFEEFGIWRLDIDDGLVYFSEDASILHGLDPVKGAVDLAAAVRAYHPEDRHHFMECLEDAITRKTGFRFILRIGDGGNEDQPKILEVAGRFRTNKLGRPELFGTVRQVLMRVRSVSLNA